MHYLEWGKLLPEGLRTTQMMSEKLPDVFYQRIVECVVVLSSSAQL